MAFFVGAYWAQRKESPESISARIAEFLTALAARDAAFSRWLRLGKTRAAALRFPIGLDAASIRDELRGNLRDLDRQAIPELGLSFSAWNGVSAAFSATAGGFSSYVVNCAVLNFDDDINLGAPFYRSSLEQLVQAFDPDHAVVTDRVKNGTQPWDAGWFTYRRGGLIETGSPGTDSDSRG